MSALSEEQLDNVEYFASLFLCIEDVAVMIEADPDELKEMFYNRNSPFFKRYNKGFLTQSAKVRSAVIDLALRNSSPAQDMALQFSRNALQKNKSNG